MWDILCNLINSDPTVGGAIASFIGNTLSTTLSDGLKKLFRKKHEVKELKIEDCKQLIEEKDLAAILEEIKKLKNDKVVIRQANEEGKNDNVIGGLSKANKNVEISQSNKKGDNNLNVTF